MVVSSLSAERSMTSTVTSVDKSAPVRSVKWSSHDLLPDATLSRAANPSGFRRRGKQFRDTKSCSLDSESRIRSVPLSQAAGVLQPDSEAMEDAVKRAPGRKGVQVKCTLSWFF